MKLNELKPFIFSVFMVLCIIMAYYSDGWREVAWFINAGMWLTILIKESK